MKLITAAQGQTWDMLAKLYLGDEVFSREIMLRNPELSGTVIFDGGEEVRIPEAGDASEDDIEEYEEAES